VSSPLGQRVQQVLLPAQLGMAEPQQLVRPRLPLQVRAEQPRVGRVRPADRVARWQLPRARVGTEERMAQLVPQVPEGQTSLLK
jgi:hypothetical protein